MGADKESIYGDVWVVLNIMWQVAVHTFIAAKVNEGQVIARIGIYPVQWLVQG